MFFLIDINSVLGEQLCSYVSYLVGKFLKDIDRR
jgi:hypothetical protein